ncbi:helix-turn-helix domain-containing protein [Solwaraspora sp. WMMD406]|uniref:helix-turn-helix domain-containing protein n=1 Tax=Solwaraspora sp. WMMD406 TaxID=3016095 RepID=UPI002416FCFE|nr:helix-turn-helix domain-containing protein [Solwaraspora sp. WMMD406]MDG4767315.1 helix-turn-helix domain-containing protein [Solwaraspora sp. WMMD406]
MSAAPAESVRAWRPPVPGVAEVFHARFTAHQYPMHTHTAWTLLIVDDGAVRYDLDRHERDALTDLVTLLPPGVPHNGAAATSGGFRKRVLYLDDSQLPADLVGASVDTPGVPDAELRRLVDRTHLALAHRGDEFAAESYLKLALERLRRHLGHAVPSPLPAGQDAGSRQAGSRQAGPRRVGPAYRLRELLDARITAGLTLDEAAALLHFDPAYLVRAFNREYGMPPHRYLTACRVDRARRRLLDGVPVGVAATEAGFFDQSHLTRHFTRIVGLPPGRFARSDRPSRDRPSRDRPSRDRPSRDRPSRDRPSRDRPSRDRPAAPLAE